MKNEDLVSYKKVITEIKRTENVTEKEILGIGCDEFDASVFAVGFGVDYYLVNNYYGYDSNIEEIKEQIEENKKKTFRSTIPYFFYNPVIHYQDHSLSYRMLFITAMII